MKWKILTTTLSTKNGAEGDTKDDIVVDPPQRHANERFGEELALGTNA